MTTQRIYSCNLCHDRLADGTGVGLKWETNQQFRFTVPLNVETHICDRCIAGLKAATAAHT